MTGRIVVFTIALSGLVCSTAIAASPTNPGGGGQTISGSAHTAKSLDSAAGVPGASSWGGTRAAIGQGQVSSLPNNHYVNVGVKYGSGGAPTPGSP
jgi:hypothetical protein